MLGLPQVGKSTYLTQILKHISEKDNNDTLYIPNQNFDIGDYLNIIKTEKYKEIVKRNHIIGLDNFVSKGDKRELFPNSRLCIIPNEVQNPYISEFVMPFNDSEAYKFIKQVSGKTISIELNDIIINSIIQYSSGFPKLTENLLLYFIAHKNLSIVNIVNDSYIQKNMDQIYDNMILQVNDNIFKILVGLIAVGKDLSLFLKSINGGNIESSSLSLIQHLGFDKIIRSPLLMMYFKRRIGSEAISLFKSEGVKDFLSEKNKNLLGVWTADNEFKFFDNDSTILNIASGIFKNGTLLHRIDWEKTKVNEKQPLSKNDKVLFGSEVHFIFGRRDEQKPRTKSYKKLNKKYKQCIFEGDRFSKKEDFDKAEQCYKEVDNLRYDLKTKFISDTNYGQVRLANLYRIQGKLEESIEICKPIVRSTPNPYAYLCWGICEFWKGNFAQALERFEKSLAYNESYINAKLWKIRVLMHLKDFEEADLYLKKLDLSDIDKLTINSNFIYLIMNYLLALQKEFKSKNKDYNWHNKIANFIIFNQKKMPARQIPLMVLYISFMKNKEKEFFELQNKYENVQYSEGIVIDLYWWTNLFINN